jgi:hypothetical protein
MNPDPGGPKTYGSRSATLLYLRIFFCQLLREVDVRDQHGPVPVRSVPGRVGVRVHQRRLPGRRRLQAVRPLQRAQREVCRDPPDTHSPGAEQRWHSLLCPQDLFLYSNHKALSSTSVWLLLVLAGITAQLIHTFFPG